MRTVLPPHARTVPPEAALAYKGIIFDVYHWQKPDFEGITQTYEMLKRPDTVMILAIKDNKLLVIEEQHAEITQPFLSVPGGRHDRADETELDAAKRELVEETGLIFNAWKLLDVRQIESKIEHFVYYFLATDYVRTMPPNQDSGERVTLRPMDLRALKAHANYSNRIRIISDMFISRIEHLDELTQLPEYKHE